MKFCTKCRKQYPRTSDYFYGQKKHKDGLQSWCKKCHNKITKKYRLEHRNACLEQEQKYRSSKTGQKARSRSYKKYYNTLTGRLACIYWRMKHRCNNPIGVHSCYKNIKVKFRSVHAFKNYVLDNLNINSINQIKCLQIDRINNNGHYEKGNIRFVTAKINANNRRNSK